MENIIPKKKKKNPVVQPGVPAIEPVFETKAKLEIRNDTYQKLIRIPLRINSNLRTVDNRIKLLLQMRETYLDLFGFLRKFYPDVIGDYANKQAIKAKGKDRFKDGYISW